MLDQSLKSCSSPGATDLPSEISNVESGEGDASITSPSQPLPEGGDSPSIRCPEGYLYGFSVKPSPKSRFHPREWPLGQRHALPAPPVKEVWEEAAERRVGSVPYPGKKASVWHVVTWGEVSILSPAGRFHIDTVPRENSVAYQQNRP